MSDILTFNDQQNNRPVRVVKDNVKSYRNVDFNRGGSARIITLMNEEEVWGN